MILRNASFSWLKSLIETLVAFLLPPFLVRHLGQDTYGLWNILASLTGSLNLLDLGMASALDNAIASHRAQGQEAEASQVLASAFSVYLVIALIVLAVFGGVQVFGLYADKVPPGLRGQWPWVLLAIALFAALAFPMRVFEEILLAGERHYQVYGMEALAALFKLGLILGLLSLGGGLLSLAHIQLWVGVGFFAAVIWLSRRHWPLGRLPRPGWDSAKALALARYALDSSLIAFGNIAQQQAPVLLLAAILSPGQVAVYVLGARLLAQGRAFVEAAVGVTQPRYAALAARQDHALAGEMLLRGGLYSSLMGAYIGLGVALLAQPFYLLWMGPHFSQSAQVALVLAGPVTLYICIRPCEVLLYGLGRQRLIGWVNLGEALVILTLAWPLSRAWGLTGMATLVGGAMLAIRPLVVPAFACRSLGLAARRYWLAGPLKALLVCLAASPALALVFLAWRPATWPQLVLAFLAYSLIWLPCALWLGLDAGERRFWREKLGDLAGNVFKRRS